MSDDTPEDHEPVGGPPPRWRGLFVSLPRALIATLILVGVAINFANVISRYLFNFALFWAEEAMVFIIVWCVFIGAIAVTWARPMMQHARVVISSTATTDPMSLEI